MSDGTRSIPTPLCIKIRSSDALTGATYNSVLQLLRECFADIRRSNLPTQHRDGSTTVTIEELTDASEEIPFRQMDGRIVDIIGTGWDSATRLCRVPAKDRAEVSARFERGEKFYEYESVRVFTKFGAPGDELDPYGRLTKKLKKKLKQTKTTDEHFGKLVFLEVPFDLRAVDSDKLKKAVRDAALNSRTALGIVLAHREPNPQIRHSYSQVGTFNRTALDVKPEVAELLDRLAQGEVSTDPIIGLPYRRTWSEATEHARKLAEKNSRD